MNQKSMTLTVCVLIIFILMIGASAVNASPYRQTEGEITPELPVSTETAAVAGDGDEEEITLVIERKPEAESTAEAENPVETADDTADNAGDPETESTAEAENPAETADDTAENAEDPEAESAVTIENPVENTDETAENAETPEPPEAPVPENPKGSFSSHAMGFYWAPAKNAEYYEINWRDDKGHQDILRAENDDWTCQAGRCIVYAELPTDGNYTWTVTAFNENGDAKSEEVNFTVKTEVPSADPYRPASALDSSRPLIFEWEDAGSAVSAYRIQVVNSETDEVCFDKTYSTDAVRHINGECYLETGEYFPSGIYQWRVRGMRGSSASEWSAWKAFELTCAACVSGNYQNSTSAAFYPQGVALGPNPRFVWKALTGALSYQLEVKDSAGTVLFYEEVLPTNCLIETCSYVPELTLTTGETYSWAIEAYGWNGSFWGRDDDFFTAAAVPEMKEFSFVGPENNASLDPDNQQIIWTDPGVETPVFRLGIRDENDEWQFITDLNRQDAWCDGITCSIQFRSIPAGENYEIVLIPYSEFNTPGTPVTLTFNNEQTEIS